MLTALFVILLNDFSKSCVYASGYEKLNNKFSLLIPLAAASTAACNSACEIKYWDLIKSLDLIY